MSTDRTAIVTGASSGIGAAVARELHRRGWKVGLVARRADELQALAASLGAGAAWRVADVTDQAAVEAAVAALEAELGPCRLLLANAGRGDVTRVDRWDATRINAVMRLNYEGVVNAVGAVLPGMLARGRGQIAATSSLAAWRGMPRSGSYSASKAAVSNLLESIRPELAARGIAVTTVHAGFVRTPLTEVNKFPMPFLMELEPAARLLVDGLERGRREVNFPWPLVLLVRLLRLLPNWLFDPLSRRAF